jgi:hypothetical protein
MDCISQTEGGAFTRRGEAWSEATELERNSYRVRLGGPFKGAWLASLSRHLGERQISIDHTHARLTGAEIWIAEFHLLALAPAIDLLPLDYIALAERAEPTQPAAFELASYRLIESRDYGGSLMLTLEAADSLGLLGALLGGLGDLGLFPVELHIETRGGRAYDSLWLTAAGGTKPPAAAREAAELFLARSHRAASS